MPALRNLDVSPAVLAKARRAAAKLRKSMPVKGRAASQPVAFKTDSLTVLPLLKLVDVIVAQQPRAPRQTADEAEITPNQAAGILKMSRPSVMRLIEQGELHPRMVHSRHKLLRAEVVALAERQTRERRIALANLTELSEAVQFLTAPARPVAVLDACILLQGRLTNLLLWRAESSAFEPIWSDAIHAEWSRNLAASKRRIPPARIDWRKTEMERAFPAANCAADSALTLAVQAMCRTPAQRGDAHVVATAVQAKASTIVTHNIKDFAPTVMQHYGLAKIRPDAFCVDLLVTRQAQVLTGLREHRNSLQRTRMDPAQYVTHLCTPGLGLTRFSQQLQAHPGSI